jgi:hypothetical protein
MFVAKLQLPDDVPNAHSRSNKVSAVVCHVGVG